MKKTRDKEKTNTKGLVGAFLSQNIIKIMCVVCGLLFYISYITARGYFGMLQDPVCAKLGITNADQFATLSFLLPLSYGISQIFSGSLLAKFGIIVIPLFALLGGVSTLSIAFVDSYAMVGVLRILSGIAFSVASIGFMFMVTRTLGEKYFGILSTVGITLAYLIAGNLPDLFNKICGWQTGLLVIGAIIICTAFLMFVFYSSVKENSNEGKEESVPIMSTIKKFFSTKKLVVLACYSTLINWVGYPFFDGWIGRIVKKNFTTAGMDHNTVVSLAGTPAAWLGYTIAGTSVILSPFISKIGYRNAILTFAGINALGVLLLILCPNVSWIVMYLSPIMMGIGTASHMIPQLYIGKAFAGQKASGLYISIMNCFAMLLGATVSQKLTGFALTVLDNSIGDPLLSLMTLLKYGFLPISVIALLLILFVNIEK